MTKSSGLTVRQHEREGIELPIELVLSPAHAQQVRFSPASGAAGAHMIKGEAIDISSGGMGLRCRHFVPRMCEGILRVFAPSTGRSQTDASALRLAFEHKVKVRRVVQSDRQQVYSIGVAFLDPDSDLEQKINALLNAISNPPARLHSAGGVHA